MPIVTYLPTRRKQTHFPNPIGDRPRLQDTGEIVEVYGNPGARYLLDTNICIYIAKRNPPTFAYVLPGIAAASWRCR